MISMSVLSASLSTLGFGALALGNLDVGGFLTSSEFVGAIGQAIVTILTNLFALLLGFTGGG